MPGFFEDCAKADRERELLRLERQIHGVRQRGLPMPKKTWSDKRERQYQHILDSERTQGKSKEVAKEIAARTVNKVRAQEGEARQSSRTSTDDMAPSRRGGQRSHSGAQGRTRAQLYEDARRKNIAGRSKMNKQQLQEALER